MSLRTRKHLLVLLSVLVVAPTSLVVALWMGLYVLISLHLGASLHLALNAAFLLGAGALLAYWVLLLDLCSVETEPLPARSPAWILLLGGGVILAIGLLALGVALSVSSPGIPADMARYPLLTGPPVLLPTLWLLALRAEHTRAVYAPDPRLSSHAQEKR